MLTDEKIKKARRPDSFVSVINSWLGRRDAKITLDLDGTECDVQEIRELLDEDKLNQSQART